jgi:hypothetical protein
MNLCVRQLFVLIAAVALFVGCDKAQTLLDDARKEAEKTLAAEPAAEEPQAESSEPPVNPMAVTPPTPVAPDSAALIAQWHATPSNQRGDIAVRNLLAASPESLLEITAFDFRSVGPELTAAGLRLLKDFPLVKSVDCSLHPLDAEQMAALCELSQLEDLSLTTCGLSDPQVEPLKKVATLRSLNLTSNHVSDSGLAAIHNLVEVQSLTLANTRVNGASLLKAKFLGNLKSINVDSTPFSQGFQALRSAPNLESIDVANTSATDEHLKFLGSHKQLRKIRISGNQAITDRGLSFLEGNPQLESLDIKGTAITGAGLKFLKGTKKLKELHTRDSRVDFATLTALRKMLPDCTID